MTILDPFWLRWRRGDMPSRLKAVREVADQDTLSRIAKSDLESELRIAAAMRLDEHWIAGLDDQTLLAEIAGKSRSVGARMAAASRLEDTVLAQGVFIEIARSNQPSQTRCEAIDKLEDRGALAEIAIAEEDEVVAGAAAARVGVEALLVRVASVARSDRARREAQRRIRDRDSLVSVAMSRNGIPKPETEDDLVRALSSLPFTRKVATVLASLGWTPKSSLDCAAYFDAVGWPEGFCRRCHEPIHEVPGHTGGDDYYGGMGSEVLVSHCGCGHPRMDDGNLFRLLLEAYRTHPRRP